MERRRILVPRLIGETDFIVFQCSNCKWEHRVEMPRPFLIDYSDADRACRAFDAHRCAEHGARSDHGGSGAV